MTEPALSIPDPESPRHVGVQFRRAAAVVHSYLAGSLTLPHGTRVVVETEHGEALAWTVGEVGAAPPPDEGAVAKRVLRVANVADLATEVDLRGREREALRFCALRARELGLEMKLVAVEWQHSGGRAVFYFSSEERVDFRALVRELAQKYRCRVEMRQVGPRDEAKIIGAMGPCGRETCCSSWMRGFAPVSIKMAKDQGLALNPQKTMGVCGRLLCCLSYEQETYTALRKELPRVGKQVETPQGPGRVVDVLALRGYVRVALDAGGRWEEFPGSEVRVLARSMQDAEPAIKSTPGEPAHSASAAENPPSQAPHPKTPHSKTSPPKSPRSETSRSEARHARSASVSTAQESLRESGKRHTESKKPSRHPKRPRPAPKGADAEPASTPKSERVSRKPKGGAQASSAQASPPDAVRASSPDQPKPDSRHKRRRRRGKTPGKPAGDDES